MKKTFQNKRACTVIVMVLAILILTITNYTKVLQGGDITTRNLYGNSEGLVYNEMILSYDAEYEQKYGLSDMYPYNGTYEGGLTDEVLRFERGYCTTDMMIAVVENEVTKYEYVPGNTLVFFNGDRADIIESETREGYIFAKYPSAKLFSFKEQDDLKYVCVYNNEQDRYMPVGDAVGYESQIGLQGMLFKSFPKSWTLNQAREVYKVVLASLYAVVLSFICYGIYKKYNIRFAVVFYAVTLLSPWMIGYSTNLYWVEFTWFLPTLIGIYCANNIESKKARVVSYVGVMAAIFIKSACGYEYISTIMMGAIVFLLTDLTVALLERKDKVVILRLFKTIFMIGIFAILGFVIALLCHGYMRGDGNIYYGLRAIYYNDVLRRTHGDPNMFQGVYADSLNASVIRVVLRYLVFDTPVILGVPGILFIPLIMLSFFTLVYGVWKKQDKKDMLVLYIWMGIASVSWFVLGKSHSYIHTMMNFVMWYFGFIQIMFYSIIEVGYHFIKRKSISDIKKEQ